MINTASEGRIPVDQSLMRTISSRLPLVLFLGQSAWTSSAGTDTILALALERLGRSAEDHCSWSRLIGPEGLPDDFYGWLAERFSRRAQPEWLESIAALPWSAIFTSSLDQGVARAFTTPFREPQVILTSAEVPVAARSTARTPLYHVFGRAGAADQLAMPPRSRQEMRIRQTVHSIPILNRLPDTMTALGTLVIEGLDICNDWLDPNNLLAVIEQLPPGRIIWCGVTDSEAFPEDYRTLVSSGHILTTPSRLASIVGGLQASGRLSDYSSVSDLPGVISFQSGSYSPAPNLRIRVEAAASIVDDSWTAFQAPLGEESLYAAFRRFHGDAEGPRGLVQGIDRGFAIIRDFEKVLQDRVTDAIENHARYKAPMIVHGQSGTGKSIALARLVSFIRRSRQCAVLYSLARVPLSMEVEEFCAEAEVKGSAATVIVCDTNASLNRYADLLFGLRSRGRRVVLVGSTYKQIDFPGQPPETFIEAPEELSLAERNQLSHLISQFGGSKESLSVGVNRHVLINLYHLLPSSRSRLAAGLSKEVRFAENLIRNRSASVSSHDRTESVLAEKLRNAGFEASDDSLLINVVDDALAGLDDDAAKLIDYVMIPGQIGCPVPLDLLLRAINSRRGKLDLAQVVHIFEGLDLFRWKQGETSEDFLLSPRLMLEAEIICRRRMLNARTEGGRIVDLLSAARLNWDAGGTERRFVLDLLHRMGPDGPKRSYYRDTYLQAARALTDLRTHFGVRDPSLMLQESVLRRSAIREGVVPIADHPTILEEARSAVQEALDQIEQSRGSGALRTRSNLLSERATIFGYLAVHEAQTGSSIDLTWSAYLAARTAAHAAVGVSETYFPLDVSLWIPADLLKDAALPPQYQAELEADIYSVLDRVDPNSLPIDQQEQYNRRKYSIGQVLASSTLSEEAFKALKEQGSTAGFFLRARGIGPAFDTTKAEVADADELQKASEAISFLLNNWSAIQKDERCLRYYLQCRWMVATKHRLFKGERAPLPFSDSDRRDLLHTVEMINALSSTGGDNPLRYLEAVLSWLLNQERQAADKFRELSRDSDFLDPRRVNRRHVLSDEQGYPQIFSGRIEAETDPGRFTLRVDGLDRRIQLLERDFPNRELGYGRQVSGFAITFNFIGPVADAPIKRGATK